MQCRTYYKYYFKINIFYKIKNNSSKIKYKQNNLKKKPLFKKDQ